jgi:hypothetical protein
MRRIFWIALSLLAVTFLSAQSKPADLQVVPDLAQRVAKFRRVQMPFHAGGLTPRERQLVAKLVDASRYLEEIFWRQMDPEALDLYKSLGDKPDANENLRRYIRINASSYDLLDENKPFVGTEPMPPAAAITPRG